MSFRMLFFKNKGCWRNLKPLPTLVGEKRVTLRRKRKNFLEGNHGQGGTRGKPWFLMVDAA